jgi:hypothetical protein
MSKLPIPVEVLNFRFLIKDSVRSHAVLELDTSTNPVRLVLTQGQLNQLATDAKITSDRLSSRRTGCLEPP